MCFSKTGEIPSAPLLVFDGSLSIALITSDSVIALNVRYYNLRKLIICE